jgi:hypothetical protein
MTRTCAGAGNLLETAPEAGIGFFENRPLGAALPEHENLRKIYNGDSISG